MRQKAAENLLAARVLLGTGAGLSNAVASRAYYAAYQGCCWRLEEEGVELPPAKSYWEHRSLPMTTLRQGLLDADEADALQFLFQRRVAADYYPEDISDAEARESVNEAEALLLSLCVS